MTRALPRLADRTDESSRALARALRTSAIGRPPPAERRWLARIEARREELIRIGESLPPAELGVFGLADAVRWMSVPPVLGRFLMRFARELAPRSCVEVGTGLGLSGAYQGAALELNGAGRLITIDVAEEHARHAREGFDELGLKRVEVRVGDPQRTLEAAIGDAAPVDYAFVDADHQREPTLACFEQMAPHLAPGAAVVFDDVGFSIPEMAEAWRTIAGHPRISVAVRFARMGVALTADD